MKKAWFYTGYTLLFVTNLLLAIGIALLVKAHPSLLALTLIQIFNILGCYLLLGIGIALPLILLASMLSWGQFFLLLSGEIPPHLAQEGFSKVLLTLLGKYSFK